MLDLIRNEALPKIMMKLVNYIQYQGLNKKNIDSINLTFKIIQSISMGIQKKF